MNFEFEKAFVRDFRKVKNQELAASILEVIEQVWEAASQIHTCPIICNIKELTAKTMAKQADVDDLSEPVGVATGIGSPQAVSCTT